MLDVHTGLSAAELLIDRIESLRVARGWSEARLARELRWDQPRLNKCMKQRQRFSVSDLDALAAAFGLTVPELFFDEYGQWDRRSKTDRRKGERRQRAQTIFDPTLEPSPAVSRLSFPPKHDDA